MKRFDVVVPKPTSLPPPAPCTVCGEPVPSDSSRALFFDGKWWHVPCAPLERIPFPYGWALEKARLAVERARAEGADVSSLGDTVARLEAAAAAWPGPTPERIFAEAAVAVRELLGLRDRAT